MLVHMQITQVLNSYETVEQSGTWGTTTNTNLSIIDRLTNGVVTISFARACLLKTITTSDGVLSGRSI